MIVITREQAICMFFLRGIQRRYVKKLTKEVDDFVDGEICYTEDPTKPIICSLKTLKANSNYYQYPATITDKE
ncbi:uncharacterized protein B0P05DRAFT_526072 [Gilbertella persicaria]|uniref:uncharacterized protein n=1 Tax=Gilbertella persicaria TaxID=101096 RepID=UPI0022207B79|nr:uncharacterized protein B0P05DRAFT_526072 [Gilbertella persicaria]KAI8092385.1 hypothetical protein B0P05DRAFT_526072 [Gilbertella persicaria]